MKVLYVDDEADIREIAVMALELDSEMEVRAAASGSDALAQLDGDAWRPDVMLLDVMMPGMDGPTTLAAIRERPGLGATPAIFITARAQPHEKAQFLQQGAIAVITKPFDPMGLAGDVRGALAGA